LLFLFHFVSFIQLLGAIKERGRREEVGTIATPAGSSMKEKNVMDVGSWTQSALGRASNPSYSVFLGSKKRVELTLPIWRIIVKERLESGAATTRGIDPGP
jgi:hypothetical protein